MVFHSLDQGAHRGVAGPGLGGTMVAGNGWKFNLTDNDTVLGSGRHVTVDSPVPPTRTACT